jgi:hypothetical protein
MMSTVQSQKQSVMDWLLEKADPGARYLAMRDLDSGAGSRELASARRAAHREGPIASLLEHMQPEGYWSKAGAGYGPKYYSTVWSIIQLAQLGGSVDEDARIRKACAYLLDHALALGRQFSYSGAPAGTILCLHGNLSWALLELGWDPEALRPAFDWMGRMVTGEGIAPASTRDADLKYYAYACGPRFACGPNSGRPCAWAAVKSLLAYSAMPTKMRTPVMRRAIRQGTEFLFETDPVKADFPARIGGRPSQNWWKFGFPVFYISDMLQLLEAAIRLGCQKDKRLQRIAELVQAKQNTSGQWSLEYHYAGKTWVNFGRKGTPNKWVTIRAVRALNEM